VNGFCYHFIQQINPHTDAETKLLQQFVVFVKGIYETKINNLSISLDIAVF
jgi:hypothetical protein